MFPWNEIFILFLIVFLFFFLIYLFPPFFRFKPVVSSMKNRGNRSSSIERYNSIPQFPLILLYFLRLFFLLCLFFFLPNPEARPLRKRQHFIHKIIDENGIWSDQTLFCRFSHRNLKNVLRRNPTRTFIWLSHYPETFWRKTTTG